MVLWLEFMGHSTDQDQGVSGPLFPVAVCMEVNAISSGTVLSRRDSLPGWQSTEQPAARRGIYPRDECLEASRREVCYLVKVRVWLGVACGDAGPNRDPA